MFRSLSLLYGWTPEEIGALTFYQVFIYSGGAEGSHKSRRIAMTDEEYAAFQQRRQLQAAGVN